MQITTVLAALIAFFELVKVCALLIKVYEAFTPWIFLPHFAVIKGFVSVVFINLKTRKFVHNDVVIFVVLNWLYGISALLGLNNEEWFFQKDGEFSWPADQMEFTLWVVEIVLSSLMLIATIGPNLEIKILPSEDGRLYVPLGKDDKMKSYFFNSMFFFIIYP